MLTRRSHPVKKAKHGRGLEPTATGVGSGVDAEVPEWGQGVFLGVLGGDRLDKRMGGTYDGPPRL